MCCGDWRTHGSEYYECSRYKSNPNIVNESAGIQAREALKKYLFYFERVIATLNCDQFLFQDLSLRFSLGLKEMRLSFDKELHRLQVEVEIKIYCP